MLESRGIAAPAAPPVATEPNGSSSSSIINININININISNDIRSGGSVRSSSSSNSSSGGSGSGALSAGWVAMLLMAVLAWRRKCARRSVHG